MALFCADVPLRTLSLFLSTGQVRGWRNTVNQVLRGFVLLTPAHCYAELVLHTFWNVQPVQVGVQET